MNKQSIPMYALIESLIRNRILSGQLDPGDKLPNAEELAKSYGVSTITIRHSLSRLEAEGLITKSRGKGTFISQDISLKKQFVIRGNVQEFARYVSQFETIPLKIEPMLVSETRNRRDIRTFFNLSDADTITVTTRLRLHKKIPISFLENFIPNEIARHLTMRDLRQRKPLRTIISKKLNLSVTKGELSLEVTSADADVVRFLNIPMLESLILVRLYYWHSTAEPFEIVNIFLRSDYFLYKSEIDMSSL